MVHGQNLIEAVVVPLQSLAQHRQPLIHRVDACFGEPARALRAIDAADDEPSIFEHLEMLGDGRLGHIERFRKLVDGGFSQSEAGQNGATRGIGESRERGVSVHKQYLI